MTPAWTAEFDETGGYDCMFGAYHVKYCGVLVFSVDLQDWGQEPCLPNPGAVDRAGVWVAQLCVILNQTPILCPVIRRRS